MNRTRIEFFAWPNSKPVRIDTGLVRHTQLSEYHQSGDDEKINANWNSQLKTGKFKYYGDVGSLWNFRRDNGSAVASYIPTEYKVYNAIAFPHKSSEPLSDKLREMMRVSSVGGVILTLDDRVLVQRRAQNITAGGFLDSGVAGICLRDKENRLNFESAVFEKLLRELKITPENVLSLQQTAIYSSIGYDFSGMISYLVKVNMEFGKVEERVNRKYTHSLLSASIKEIPKFLMEHYAGKEDLVGDGCASLLSILEPATFNATVEELRKKGKSINFGTLQEGKFVSIE